MPVNSNSSQGNNSMYIQPAPNSNQSPAGTPPGLSKITTNITKQNTSDAISISAGDDFYSIYTDKTLESVLVSRGFSQLRPEVLGSFEFVPPLSSDSVESSQDDGQVVYNSSGAGELLDMQNQLKQLRYAETMYFLRIKCGLLYADEAVETESGLLLQTNTLGQTYTFCDSSADVSDSNYVCAFPETPLTELYPHDHSASNHTGIAILNTGFSEGSNAVLLQSFNEDMAKASSVLEFLAAALSVYELKSAVDIKINNYVDKNSADSTTTAGSIADRLDLYDDDFVANKAPGNISLESYLKDFLGMPAAYWDNASSTALVMQLIADIVGRTGYPQESLGGFTPKESNEFGPGEILGIDKNEYSGGYDVLKQLGKIDISELKNYNRKYSFASDSVGLLTSSDTTAGTPRMDDDSSGSDIFTRGDFFDLWERLIDQKDPKLFYVVARDFINHCQMKSTKSPETSGHNLEDRLKNLIGWNPFEQIKNLSEIQADTSGQMLGIDALRPRKSTFDVATFNKGDGDTPSGGAQIKPGMEYYLSEFLAGGSISDSLEKMTEFSEGLDKLTTDLMSFLDFALTPNKGSGMGAPENSLAYGTGGSMNPNNDSGDADLMAIPINQQGDSSPTVPSLSPVGIGSDSGSTSNSAALVQRVFEEFTKTLTTMYLTDIEWSSCNCFGEAGQILWFAAAANDPACAWEGLKYLLARDSTMKGDPSFPIEASGDLYDIGDDLLSLTQDFFQMNPGGSGKLTKYGYGYDEDAFAYEDSDSTYTEQITVEEENTVFISMLRPGLNLGTDYDGAWFDYWYGGRDLTWTQADGDGGYSLVPALSDSVGRALEYWEVATADGLGVESELSQNSAWEGLVTNDLGIGRQGRLVMCYLFALAIMQQTQKFAIWVPGEHAQTSYDTWYNTRWSLSKRAIAGLSDANDLKNLPDSGDWGLTSSSHNAKDSSNWDVATGSGYSESIEESINLFWTYYRPQLEYDVLAWNSLYFLTEISDRVREIIDEILSTFSGGLSETSITEQLSDINTSGNLSEIVSASLTRDQVTLSRYLEASISTLSSKYPYLPTMKSVEPNQAMCLGTLCQINYLVESPMSGKKRIFALGLPSGMIEFLRNSAADEMSNPRYNESNVIKISLWRRNLLNETICETPQEFLFDVSRFVYPDTASAEFFEGQTVDDLLDHTSITKFTKDGPGTTYVGKAYDDDVIRDFDAEFTGVENLVDIMGNAPIGPSSPTSNALVQVFNNHVLDHYLKLYLRLTSGIDVREDSFCFLEDETSITSPDPDKVSTHNEMLSLLSGMYDSNNLAAGITFQRVSGELTRSIMLSPEKYRNRIIYPKIFDRVFCIVVDDADWIPPQSVEESVDTTESGNLAYENTQSEATSTSVQTDPTYFQYFITVSIMTEVDPEEGEVSSLS